MFTFDNFSEIYRNKYKNDLQKSPKGGLLYMYAVIFLTNQTASVTRLKQHPSKEGPLL